MTVAHRALANFMRASPLAAEIALRCGLLGSLARHIAATTAADAEQRRTSAAQVQRVAWPLRLVGALLSASPSALSDAMTGSVASLHGGPALLVILQSTRHLAEKDDRVCAEVLELLRQCCHAERAPDVSGRAVRREDVPGFLLRTEFVQWLMRLSQRPKSSPVIHCKTIEVLSLCAPALAGRPVLFRFITQALDEVRSACRAGSHALAEEWSCKRLAATLDFFASLRHCAKSVDIILSIVPPAHATSTGPDVETMGSQSCALWLDLLEPGRGFPAPVRAAALRVLLAVVMGPGQKARCHLLGTARTWPLLLRLLEAGSPPVVVLTLSLLWALAHGSQRVVAELRPLKVTEAAARAIAAWPLEGSAEEHEQAELAAQQLALLLR